MSAIITRFDSRGDVRDVKPTSFHFIGSKESLAVEVQIGQNSTVEIPVKEIFSKLLER
jgi:hypothetical protein